MEFYDGEYKYVLTSIGNEADAKKIEEDLKTKEFIVGDVSKKETIRLLPNR